MNGILQALNTWRFAIAVATLSTTTLVAAFGWFVSFIGWMWMWIGRGNARGIVEKAWKAGTGKTVHYSQISDEDMNVMLQTLESMRTQTVPFPPHAQPRTTPASQANVIDAESTPAQTAPPVAAQTPATVAATA